MEKMGQYGHDALELCEAALDAMLNGAAYTKKSLRSATVDIGRGKTAALPVPVAVFAQAVRDDPVNSDFALLIREGYTEEAAYELLLCTSFGFGLARLDRGLAALEGLEPEETNLGTGND